jgi:hypothetical protein
MLKILGQPKEDDEQKKKEEITVQVKGKAEIAAT